MGFRNVRVSSSSRDSGQGTEFQVELAVVSEIPGLTSFK
jgi:hypothetical protein